MRREAEVGVALSRPLAAKNYLRQSETDLGVGFQARDRDGLNRIIVDAMLLGFGGYYKIRYNLRQSFFYRM